MMISKIKTFLRFKTKCFISRTGGCRFGCCLAVREEVVAPGGAEGLPGAGGEELGEGGGGVVQLEEGEAEGVQGEGGAAQPRRVGRGTGGGLVSKMLLLPLHPPPSPPPPPPAPPPAPPREAEVEAEAGGPPGTRATRSLSSSLNTAIAAQHQNANDSMHQLVNISTPRFTATHQHVKGSGLVQ